MIMAEMDVKLLFLAAILLVAQTIDAVQETQGLYIFLRNESTRLVSVREIVVSPTESKTMASLSSWKVDLVKCSEDVQLVTYSTMDTVRKTFIGQFMGVLYFFAVHIPTMQVSHIPAKGGYMMYECLTADPVTGNLIAIDYLYSKNLNSVDIATGNLTPLMDVSTIADKVANGYSYDSDKKVLYSLSFDSVAGVYSNLLYIIDIANKNIVTRNISATYKVCGVSLDSRTKELFAMEFQEGWYASKMQQFHDVSPASSQPPQTVYFGRINQQTWKFERLVNLTLPFYSNNYLQTYSSARGWYVLAWPEPDYDPYVSSNNGVLQVVDVRNKATIYNNQVHGWSMRGKVGAGQNVQLILDMAFSG